MIFPLSKEECPAERLGIPFLFTLARQQQKKQEHGIVSYDALGNGEMVGVEDMVIAKDLNKRLHHAVAALPSAERELIRAIRITNQKAQLQCEAVLSLFQ